MGCPVTPRQNVSDNHDGERKSGRRRRQRPDAEGEAEGDARKRSCGPGPEPSRNQQQPQTGEDQGGGRRVRQHAAEDQASHRRQHAKGCGEEAGDRSIELASREIEKHHEQSTENGSDQPRRAGGEPDRQHKRPARRVVSQPPLADNVGVWHVEEFLER